MTKNLTLHIFIPPYKKYYPKKLRIFRFHKNAVYSINEGIPQDKKNNLLLLFQKVKELTLPEPPCKGGRLKIYSLKCI